MTQLRVRADKRTSPTRQRAYPDSAAPLRSTPFLVPPSELVQLSVAVRSVERSVACITLRSAERSATNEQWPTRHRAFLLLLVPLLLLAVSTSDAQFQLDIRRVADTAFPKEDDTEEPDTPNPHQQQMMGRINIEQNIDGWVFNRHRNEAGARKHLARQLKIAIDSVDRVCELSDEQTDQLRLAAAGDETLFFSEIEQIRNEFRGENDQNKINQVWQRVQPLQVKMQNNLFGRGSILNRVIEGMLTADQLDRFQEVEQARIRFAYTAAIKLAISQIEKNAPLKTDQRVQLFELLDNTTPPKIMGSYSSFYVMYQLAKNEDELRRIVDERQLQSIQARLKQGKSMEQLLKQNGYID